MTDTYTFAHAQESDREAVLAVYRACVGLPGCTWDYDYPSAETFANDLIHDWLYCLRQDDEIVGVVSLGAFGELGEDDIPWSEAHRHCEIGRIGVLPGARGRGLGRRLLELALDEARRQGFDAMRLLVSPENLPALAIYRRAGFRTVGETDRFDLHWLCQELSLDSEQSQNTTTVYFVRHAESDLRIMDDATRPLTARGLRDRELVTAYLAAEPLTAIYSSPYRRAVDTVTPLAGAHGLTVQKRDGFRERNVVGKGWVDDYDVFAQQQWADFDYALPGGESLRVTQGRNLDALRALLTQHSGETLAVGSHGIALSTIIHHYDPSFGCEGFHRIEGLMPWLVRFGFEGLACTDIVEIDLLHGAAKRQRELSRRKES